MLYMVNKYGFMPNGNRTWFLYHSQPPFLSVMARRIYDFYKDRAWLKGAYECLKTEYDFWMTRRSSPVELSAGIYLSAKYYIKNADKGEI